MSAAPFGVSEAVAVNVAVNVNVQVDVQVDGLRLGSWTRLRRGFVQPAFGRGDVTVNACGATEAHSWSLDPAAGGSPHPALAGSSPQAVHGTRRGRPPPQPVHVPRPQAVHVHRHLHVDPPC